MLARLRKRIWEARIVLQKHIVPVVWIPSPFPLSPESSYPEPEKKDLDIWMTQATGLLGHFREQNSEEGAFSKHESTDVQGRAETGCLLQEQLQAHRWPGARLVLRLVFKSSQDVIFPRGHQLIPKEERILEKESDVSECGWNSVASKFWVEVIRWLHL